jgi:DNA polymerase-3 subunit alpha
MPMRMIFCFVCVKAKKTAYRFGLLIRNTISRREEMKKLFTDLPESISNLRNCRQIEIYDLAREVLLPKFDIPDEFDVAQDSVDGGVKCLFETSYLRRGKQKVS